MLSALDRVRKSLHTHTKRWRSTKPNKQISFVLRISAILEARDWRHVAQATTHAQTSINRAKKYKICSLTWETFEDETSYEVKQQTQLLSFT